MLTKSQQVRQYQQERYLNRATNKGIMRFDKYTPTRALLVEKDYPEYNPNQPRDERGRWSAGGALGAALLGGAAVAGGLWARNNPKAVRAGLSAAQRAASQGMDAARRGLQAARRSLGLSPAAKPRRAGGAKKPPAPQGPTPSISALRRQHADLKTLITQHEAAHKKLTRDVVMAERQLKNIRVTSGNAALMRTRADRIAALKEELRWSTEDLKSLNGRLRSLETRLRRGRAAASKKRDVRKYRPDQARDDHGQWTEDGGGSRAAAGSESSRQRKPRKPEAVPPTSEPLVSNSDKWAIARELGINAALIGATIYGGPAVASAGRSAVGRTAGARRALAEAYNRMRQRVRQRVGAG